MALIFETTNFLVQSAEFPLVDRNDGGHITIDPKFPVATRQQLTPSQAIELMRIISVAGEAMTSVMRKHGVEIGRINYQDNGNWSVFKPGGPQLHYHLYGRAKNAAIQRYGQTLYFPHKDEEPAFYQSNAPLTEADVDGIREMMQVLLDDARYSNRAWGLE
jgi:diadenosine tetraphosphate (Ap4A) HIT family hydrolase